MRTRLGRFKAGYRSHPSTEFKKGQHWREKKPFWEKAWLENEYVNKKKSAADIGIEFGIGATAILFWIKKHGIQTRNTAENRKIKKWGLLGDKNPMFGRRGSRHHGWKGGQTPYRQFIYSRRELGQFALSIFRRDVTCLICGSTHKREIHHIITVAEAPLLIMDPNNVILLCKKCHLAIQGKERKHQKRLFQILNDHLLKLKGE